MPALTELRELALSGGGFTDAGLNGLAELRKLRRLRLFETAVTSEGSAAFKARRPEVQIEAWNRNSHD